MSPLNINTDDCWLYAGTIDRYGYGIITSRGGLSLVHRLMYEKSKGHIPEGMCIHHECEVRSCINPDHLRPVTNLENLYLSSKYNGNKTHCRYGHAFKGDNLKLDYIGKYVFRRCRICIKRRVNEAKLRAVNP